MLIHYHGKFFKGFHLFLYPHVFGSPQVYLKEAEENNSVQKVKP